MAQSCQPRPLKTVCLFTADVSDAILPLTACTLSSVAAWVVASLHPLVPRLRWSCQHSSNEGACSGFGEGDASCPAHPRAWASPPPLCLNAGRLSAASGLFYREMLQGGGRRRRSLALTGHLPVVTLCEDSIFCDDSTCIIFPSQSTCLSVPCEWTLAIIQLLVAGLYEGGAIYGRLVYSTLCAFRTA